MSFKFTLGGRGIDTQGRLGMMTAIGRMGENTPEETRELSSLQASPQNQVWSLSVMTQMSSPMELKPGGNRHRRILLMGKKIMIKDIVKPPPGQSSN